MEDQQSVLKQESRIGNSNIKFFAAHKVQAKRRKWLSLELLTHVFAGHALSLR